MARKNQKLINFHTGSLTSMPQASEVDYGEIVVRHNEQQPELLVKVSESDFGVIPGSGAVANAISVAVKGVTDYVDGEVDNIEASIAELQESVSGISTNIGDNYVSNEALEEAQDELFASATTVAFEDATAKVEAAKIELNNTITAATNSLQKNIDAVDEKADANATALGEYKDEVAETYETKTNVVNAITAAKGDVYSSATTAAAADAKAKDDALFTSAMTKVNAVSTELSGAIDAVNDRVDTVSGNLNTFKAEVANTYETKENVASAITDAKDAVYASATTAAADDATIKAGNAKDEALAAAAASAATLLGLIEAVDDNLETLSGNVHTTIEALEGDLIETINDKVAVAYRYAGSCTYAELPASGSVIGEVWNVTDANGNFPAGTNYAWDGEKWDALGGSIDLSPYALKTELTGATEGLQNNIDAANGRIDTVSGNLNTFKAYVAETYATKDDVADDITDAKDAVYASATTAASNDATAKVGAAKTELNNALTAATNTLQSGIDAVNGRVDTLSGVTATVKSVADSAVQSASVSDGVKVSKEGTELKFDFSEIIIDCGDF